MQLSFPRESGYQPNQRIHAVVMATDSEIREFLEEICEVSIPVENNFPVFEHTNNAPKPCKFVSTETFDGMPNQIVETFVI